MQTLTDEEMDRRLENLDGWTRVDNRIRKEYSLKDFVQAVQFTRDLVEPAEEANHHPDLEVSWGSVVVNLTTHDAGGLTPRDFKLAAEYDALYGKEYA